jgi:hypothetical protein
MVVPKGPNTGKAPENKEIAVFQIEFSFSI